MKKPRGTVAMLVIAGFALCFLAGTVHVVALIALAIGAILTVLVVANRVTDGAIAERNQANTRHENRGLTYGLVFLILGGVLVAMGQHGLQVLGASLFALGILGWILVSFFGSPAGSKAK
jgi:hypothetical protein